MTIYDLIKLTNNGLEAASFGDVRAAITERYKAIYGSDIDLATSTADGVFVNDMALLVTNIIDTVSKLYENLNIDSASGVYLDNLCKISNITRREATRSNASITVTNNGSSTFDEAGVYFIDQAGTEWTYADELIIAPGASASIIVTCTRDGAISAPAGWIDRTVLATSLDVVQTTPANVGRNAETDSQLRARRGRSVSPTSNTVLEALVSSLFEVDGVEDAWIYDNNQGSTASMDDGTDVAAHSIYVVIRQQGGVTIPDSVIGTIIQEKLTPGILTTATDDSTHGTGHSYTFALSVSGIQVQQFTKTVYWKVATPINPTLTVPITIKPYFNEAQVDDIAKVVMDFANSTELSETIDLNNMLIKIMMSDPLFKNQNTFSVGTITLANSNNYNTYYNYTSYTSNKVGNVITLTFS